MLKDLLSEVKDIIEEFFKKEEVWFLIFLLVLGGYFSFLLISKINFATLKETVIGFLKTTWWLWLFFILMPLTASTWLAWRNEVFKRGIKWTMLEIKIPRENTKSPQAMERVLAALYALRNAPGNFKERWLDGEVTRWFSLEIVSFSGDIHYYIRLYEGYKNIVEAALYSYYPELEVVETEDYINRFPATTEEMYRQGYNLWGTEMILSKPAIYPIKTYPHFVEVEPKERVVDPMSSFLEVLGKLKAGEMVGIQILIAPNVPRWRFLLSPIKGWPDKWEKKLEELRSPKERKIQTAGGEGKTGAEVVSSFPLRSPGEINILKEVENNLSKPAFDTLIRIIYLSPKELFYDSYVRGGLMGAFNQYSALDLNFFRQNSAINTRTDFWKFPYFFPNLRSELKKQRLLRNYRLRELPPETFMGKVLSSHPLNWNFASQRFEMNIEGLATLFHVPTATVLTTPYIQRVESRKTSPPAGLAIFGEEKEIEQFK